MVYHKTTSIHFWLDVDDYLPPLPLIFLLLIFLCFFWGEGVSVVSVLIWSVILNFHGVFTVLMFLISISCVVFNKAGLGIGPKRKFSFARF